MENVRTIDDVPSDVLFKVLQHLSTEDIYNLGRLELVNKSFRAPVMQIYAALEVFNMRYSDIYRIRSSDQRSEVIRNILHRCPRLIGMFLLGFHWENPAVPNFCKLFEATPECLSILELRHCTFSFSTLMSIGRILPHLQGLSLQGSAITDSIGQPWVGFPELRILNVDWVKTVSWTSIQALRSQFWYLSCHGCMLMGDEVCDGLNSCIVLDMAQTPLSDAGLQNMLGGQAPELKLLLPNSKIGNIWLQGAPHLQLLLLNTKVGNLWDEGIWTTGMTQRLQNKGIRVIQSAGHKTSIPAIMDCLLNVLRRSPELQKHVQSIL